MSIKMWLVNTHYDSIYEISFKIDNENRSTQVELIDFLFLFSSSIAYKITNKQQNTKIAISFLDKLKWKMSNVTLFASEQMSYF